MRNVAASLLMLCILFGFWPWPALAARTITSATLNGASSVTVSSSASITAAVTVVTDGTGSSNDWNATSWQIGSGATTCVNHADYTNSGTNTESFAITAPSSAGTYNVQFIAYRNNTCSLSASNTLTLTNGITVVVPTPTPTPTATPSPTSEPTATPTSESSASPTPESSTVPTDTPTSTPEATTQPTSTPTPTPTTQATSAPEPTPTPTPEIEITVVPVPPGPVTPTAALTAKPAAQPVGSAGTTTPQITIGETATEVPVVAEVADDRSPTVTLTEVPDATITDQFFSFAGLARDDQGVVAALSYSLDDRKTWHPVSSVQALGTAQAQFGVDTYELEDGTYPVVVRARDNSDNEGFSVPLVITVDRLPPILGTFSAALDGQNL